MAQVQEFLTSDGNPVGVEVARRDSLGNIIADTYLTKEQYATGAEYLGAVTTISSTGALNWEAGKSPKAVGDWYRWTGSTTTVDKSLTGTGVAATLHAGDILIYSIKDQTNPYKWDIVHIEADTNTYWGLTFGGTQLAGNGGAGMVTISVSGLTWTGSGSSGTLSHPTYSYKPSSGDYLTELTVNNGHVTGATAKSAGTLTAGDNITISLDSDGNATISAAGSKISSGDKSISGRTWITSVSDGYIYSKGYFQTYVTGSSYSEASVDTANNTLTLS